jgi:hypothetical protein
MPKGVYDHFKIRGRKNPDQSLMMRENNPAKRLEVREKISSSNKGKQTGDNNPSKRLDVRKKNSDYHKGLTGVKSPMFGKHHKKETKDKIGVSRKGKKNPDQSERMKGENNPMKCAGVVVKRKETLNRKSEEEKNKSLEKRKETLKRKSEEEKNKSLERWFKSNKIKPNKAEIFTDTLVQIARPNEFIYSGDGKIFIAGKVPDWFNTNGKKQLIEMFGTYWHGEKRTGLTNQQEEDRLKSHYAKYGYNCLVIWESELKEPEKVIHKIRSF